MAPQNNTNRAALPNGVRVVSEYVPYVDSVSVGIWVKNGSRDEAPVLRGVSHFIEHMMFKGTERRPAKQIADEMDHLGGHLNAFTDKETTWYYAKVLKEHLGVAFDILTDMLLNSRFDEEEIEREQNVVLEEIKRHEDTPDDMVHDLFTQALWRGQPLGEPVVGTRETVEALTRESIVEHLCTNYTPDRMVVSVAGNFEHQELLNLVGCTLGQLARPGQPQNDLPVDSSHEIRLIHKDTEQVHFCIGTPGYSQHDDRKYALAVLDAVLGGGMSSRLFQEIRENRGLVYSIGSYAMSFRDTGMFTIYAGTSMENVRECLEIIRAELSGISVSSVAEDEMVRGRNQIRGALVLGQESMSNRMSRMANSELYFGRIIPVEEVIDSIMQVSAEDVNSIAEDLFRPDGLTLAAIGPFRDRTAL